MHGILPSEIARLVLDYLEASSCPDAARVFLETSPDLQECRRVAATGGRFITRVFGLTLMNILHTFCDIYGLVQERLNRIDDDEQLRRCGDLCEQLRTLIDGCRGQRFFVNINVPAQPSNQIVTAGSPIITSSIRKRRRSASANREKCSNYSAKSHSLSGNKNTELLVSNQCNNYNNNNKNNDDNNIGSSPVVEQLINPTTNLKERASTLSGMLCDEMPVQCSSTVGELGVQSSQDNDNNRKELEKGDSLSGVRQNSGELPLEKLAPTKFSTGTDTKELMKYSTAEVQTTPYDIMESECVTTDEPVENLSLLTKELLNRTELQERIAENINKAILPTDGFSLKDLSFSECIAGSECNTSIMTELNNAIKSIVTATQADPVFERFFDEIFQPDIDEEQSPDEDTRRNIISSNECPSDESPRTMDEFTGRSESDNENKMVVDISPNDKTSQLNIESESAKVNTEFLSVNATTSIITESQALDDFNAAAVQSIINANNNLSEEMAIETDNLSNKQLDCPQYNFPMVNIAAVAHSTVPTENSAQNHQELPPETNREMVYEKNPSPILKKSTRKSKVIKQKPNPIPCPPQQLIPTDTVVVPTLIVCNQNDMNLKSTAIPVRLFNNIETGKNICTRQKSQFIPIAPKESCSSAPTSGTIYFRTVNVAQKIPNVTTHIMKNQMDHKIPEQKIQNSVGSIEKSTEIKPINEAITLYGINENNSTEVLQPSNLPTINVDESVTFSGSGLSPFLKFNKKLPQCSIAEEPTEKNSADENITVRTTDCDITKRTPKSLLKSRSMNHRLSLSTPRRRNGHIRALDFNTPPKEINTSRRLSEADACAIPSKSSDNSKSMCRTSLFKSPPFESSPPDTQKNSRVSRSTKAPSADSSPVPKLYGGWDKISGVGTILGCASSTVSSTRSLSASKNDITSDETTQHHQQKQQQQSIKTNKSWDADLRQSLDIHDRELKPREGKLRKRNAKLSVDEIKRGTSLAEKSDSNKKSELLLPIKTNRNKLSPINESGGGISNIKVMKTNLITETVTVDKKGVTKKYAKLKTLATNIKRIDNNTQSNLSNAMNISSDLSEKSVESINNHSQILSNIAMDLETPRKNDIPLGVPATPRVLSPSNTTPFVQVTEDPGKVRCFITTPEFPPTPSINLTPRQVLENNGDTTNGIFSAAYYHPSSELKEIPKVQLHNQQNNTKGSKLEITQFEVIKENLPKNEACKELNILVNPNDTENLHSTKNVEADQRVNFDNSKTNKSLENSGTTLSDSSDSESDTTSSSCSSSSCSCNDDTTNNSSRMSAGRRCKDIPKKMEIHSSMSNLIPTSIDKASDDKLRNSCERIQRQIARVPPLDNTPEVQQKSVGVENFMREKNESSPDKVFPIVKTQQALDEADTETPIKDETLLCEAEISETPSGSKSGIENLTNLTSKISALIVAKEPNARKYHGTLRKLDGKLSVDSVKSNILASFDNSEGINLVEKGLIVTKRIIKDEKKSNKIERQQESEKLYEKSGKEIGCPLKPQLKSTPQQMEQWSDENVSRKFNREVRIYGKNDNTSNENNESEAKKTLDNVNENVDEDIKNNPTKNSIKFTTDLSDKFLSINDVGTKPNSPEKLKSLTTAIISNPPITSASDKKSEINPTPTSKAELSVLESLKLVPANTTEVAENPEVYSTKPSQQLSHCEFSFIHDDTVNTKRKNIKKFSPSDLEFAIELRNDEFATLSATRFEMLFTLPSKNIRSRQTRKTKPETKSEIKSAKPTIRSIKIVKGVSMAKNNKLPPVSAVVTQPLATSSPVQTETASKLIGKVKATSDNTDDPTIKPKNSKHEIKKHSITTRKRKERTESKDDEPVEKKTTVTNPKLLLSRVNIDEFLTTVHGPVTKN